MTEIERRVHDILMDKLAVDSHELKDDAHIVEDLGADSLDLAELMMEIESEFNISISDDEGAKVKTVFDLIEIVGAKKNI